MSDPGQDDSPPSSSPEGASILQFSRWAALVARARRLTDLDALLAHPNAESLVQATAPQDLFYAIKQVGLADAQELLELCHPRQIQTFFDLDGWRRDRVELTRLAPWFEALLAAPAGVLSRAIEGMDPEIWVLLLQPNIRLYDFSLEQMDTFGEDQLVLQSPDNLYLVEIVEPDSLNGQLSQRFIAHLFKEEVPDVCRRILASTRLEIPAELEEEAYRYRRGRLADLGFVEHHEAIEAYAFLDPRRLRREGAPEALAMAGLLADSRPTSLPAPYARAFTDDSYLGRVLARITDETALERMGHELVALANRVLAVDDVDVGDGEAVQESASRMRNYVSMALEHLSGGDVIAAEPWLRGLRLVQLHRVGFSLTVELKRRADRMVRQGWLSREDARLELLDVDDRELVSGLRRRRPSWQLQSVFRDFATVQDVRAAHHALDLVELESWLLLDVLGLAPASVPRSITFGAAVRSAIVHLALEQGFRCAPVTTAQLERFLPIALVAAPHRDGRVLSEELRDEVTLYLEGLVTAHPNSAEATPGTVPANATARGSDTRALVRERARQWMDALQAELSHLPTGAKIDARFVGGLWLVP